MNGLRAPSSQRGKRFVAPPVLPRCYLCGQQFGTTSIGIHIPQCYAKKLAQWEAGDPYTRGHAPKHPDTVNWKGDGLSKSQHNDEQFKEFVSNLEPCPNCGRRFLADRLVVHLRSCKPGSTSKPVATRGAALASGTTEGGNGTSNPRPPSQLRGSNFSASPRSSTPKGSLSGAPNEEKRPPTHLDPKRNRVPHASNMNSAKLTCPQCGSVEYSTDAKFCRDCGSTLKPKSVMIPCGSCGEQISDSSRFCPSCGASVEREKESGETVRLPNSISSNPKTCPSCNAFCKQNDKFCDNCGSSLNEEKSPHSPSSIPKVELMYCKVCDEESSDLSCIFCEECGNKLEKKEKINHLPSVSSAASRGASNGKKKALPAEKLQSKSSEENFSRKELSYPEEEGESVSVERSECEYCGRRFAAEALARHQQVCRTTKRRPVFNMTKQRLQGTDIPSVKSSSHNPPAPPKHNWKKESEDFRKALREARKVEQILKAGGDVRNLPPPTYSENPNYRQCPHCQRRFAPDVAERHIPKCATTVNRPKAPPKRRF